MKESQLKKSQYENLKGTAFIKKLEMNFNQESD